MYNDLLMSFYDNLGHPAKFRSVQWAKFCNECDLFGFDHFAVAAVINIMFKNGCSLEKRDFSRFNKFFERYYNDYVNHALA